MLENIHINKSGEKMEDRRIRKNKKLLKQALLLLLAKHSIYEISITELCRLADVNRSTFYYHYSYIEQLIQDVHFDIFEKIYNFINAPQKINQPFSRKEQLIELFNEIKSGEGEIALIFRKGDPKLFINDCIKYYVDRFWNENIDTDKKYVLLYNLSGGMIMIFQWISEGFPISSEKLAEILYETSVKSWIYEDQ